ncbi:MAG: hypothetical protein IMX05_01545 [Hydrogenibacillus schlegelii]|nr:hypothetical protein [Hydrogenibacillus schlegelii]
MEERDCPDARAGAPETWRALTRAAIEAARTGDVAAVERALLERDRWIARTDPAAVAGWPEGERKAALADETTLRAALAELRDALARRWERLGRKKQAARYDPTGGAVGGFFDDRG